MTRTTAQRAMSVAAALVCALAMTTAMAAGAASAATGVAAANRTAATDVPGGELAALPSPGASMPQWQAWVEADRVAASSTDWAEESAARGCTLESVAIVEEVAPEYNREMGAPADLVTIRIDLEESCGSGPRIPAQAPTPAPGLGLLSVPVSSHVCNNTAGPGTVCVYRSSGRVYASWTNRGSATVAGNLRIYRIAESASSCPTGTTWHTGPTSVFAPGQTRSTFKTQNVSGAFSAHVWVGGASWGSACAVM